MKYLESESRLASIKETRLGWSPNPLCEIKNAILRALIYSDKVEREKSKRIEKLLKDLWDILYEE